MMEGRKNKNPWEAKHNEKKTNKVKNFHIIKYSTNLNFTTRLTNKKKEAKERNEWIPDANDQLEFFCVAACDKRKAT